MTQPVALFIDPRGVYPALLGVERCWDQRRDARLYTGPAPVVAHPPCQLWVNMAAANWWRGLREGKGRPYPAWYAGGSDGGCFAAALEALDCFGGVLEHPAGSWAWQHHGLTPPKGVGWQRVGRGWWVCEVWQRAYGHACRKRTWLLYRGGPTLRAPFELRWEREPGTHQVGWFDRSKPTVSKKEAIASPVAFAEELIRLASFV